MINKKFSRNWTLDGIPIDNGFELSADVDELDEEIEFAEERADELEDQINGFDRGEYIHRQLSTAAKQRYAEQFRSVAKMAKKNNIKDALEEFGVDYKESTRKQAKRKMALQIHWRHHIDEDGKDFWTFQTTEGQYEPLDHIDLHVTQTLEGQWEWILYTGTQWGETVDDAGVEPTQERAKQAAEKKLDYYYRLFKSQMREGMVDSKEFPLFF